jgi:cytochrome c553
MKTRLLRLILGMLLISNLGQVHSESLNDLYLQSADCEKCHGHEGNSTDSLLPSLAGQDTVYLIQQINDFLKGVRKHPVLGISTEKISETYIEVLATYYSTFEAKNVEIEPLHMKSSGLPVESILQLIEQGESIYLSCSGCHGTEAEGITPYPKLAGQQLDYLKQQLIHFKTGKRINDIMQIMTVNLSDEDINALALYLSSLSTR